MKLKNKKYYYILGISSGSVIAVILAIWLFFPKIPIYLWLIYRNYSPKDTPYAYVTPKSNLIISKLTVENNGLRKIECGPISLYLRDAEKAEFRQLAENGFVIDQPKNGEFL